MENLKSLLGVKNNFAKMLISFSCGCILTLTQAPFHFVFLFIFSFFITYEITLNSKKSFLIGYVFGVGYFSTLLYWVGYSFEHVGMSLIGGFMAALLLALYLSIFSGMSFYITKKISKNNKKQFLILFPFIWCLLEFIRSNFILGGFSFGVIGYMWNNQIILQICSIGGVHLLSLISLMMISLLIRKNFKTLIISVFLIIVFGHFHQKPTSYTNTIMRLVQPSIEKKHDIKNHEIYQILSYGSDIAIWPESVSIDQFLPRIDGPYILTGAISKIDGNIFNSVVIVKNDNYMPLYNKHHLVPFGEYIPSFLKLLPIKKLTSGTIDFSKGIGPKTVDPKTLGVHTIPSFSPLICYEAIFSGKVVDKNNRPNWLLNITNDIWFGDTTGPRQHAHISKIRAIEEGLPMVRAANNGISFVCDPFGNILHMLELNQVGYIDFNLPQAIHRTIFSVFGNKLFLLALLLGFLPLFLKRKRHKKSY